MIDLIPRLKAAVVDGGWPGPRLRAELAEVRDPRLARKAGRILAGAGIGDATGSRPARELTISVISTHTLGSFPDLLRATLTGAGVRTRITTGEYGMFQISLAGGALGDAGTDVCVLVIDESLFLPEDWNPADVTGLAEQITARFAEFRGLLLGALAHTSADVLLHTVPLPAEVRDTVLSWRGRARLASAWHRLNGDLLALADENSRLAVVDLDSLLVDRAEAARDDRLHRYADLAYTDGALLALAHEARRFVQAKTGLSRKVLALDLDNTLWGGVLGEVGADGVQLGGLYPGNCYQQLQHTAARLREQGVVLVLASKNDADLAETALSEHPEAILRPAAFSALAVNWSAKAGNLSAAAESLGLAIDSFVLVDDSAFEREHVAAELPEVALVSSAGDPAHVVRTLLRTGWFDVVELTGTDRKRPDLYRSRALRSSFSSDFASSEDYLHALEIRLTAGPVDAYSVPRVAQLAARTNQFNLTGIRYDELTTAAMRENDRYLVASFAVSDRFGDEGIVGAAWVERGERVWAVTNLVLSCRVLGRGIELAIADWLAGQARDAGAARLEGKFMLSPKNGVAADFWTRAGLHPTSDPTVFNADLTALENRAPAWVSADQRSTKSC